MNRKFSAAIAAMMMLAAPMAAMACEMHAAAAKGDGATAAPAALQLAQSAPAATIPAATTTAPVDAAATGLGSAAAGSIRISGAYARSSNPQTGAVFMSIANDGTSACTLAAIQTPSAARAELHTNREEDGVMKMLKIDGIEIPAGGSHDLARGGDHVMLMQTPTPLAEGDEVALTLDFGACGSVPLTVVVEPAAGGAATHDAGMAHHGDHSAPAN